MTRDQLMKDFEETYKYQASIGAVDFTVKANFGTLRLEYVDETTARLFTVWGCAFETYSTEHING